MNPPLSLREKRSTTDIINATFRFIKVRSRVLVKSILYFAGPFYLIAGIGTGLYWFVFGLAAENPEAIEAYINNGASAAILGLVYISWIISALVGGLVVTTSVLTIMRLHDERGDASIEVSDVWRGLKGRVGAVLLGYIILGIFAGIGMFALIALAGVASAVGGEGAGVLVGILAFIVGFFGGVYVFVSLAAYFPLLVIEREGLLDSIQRSFYLVRGYFWTALGAVFLAGVIAGILTAVFTVPSYVIMFAQMVMTAGEGGSWFQVASVFAGIVSTLGSALVGCIPTITQGMLYYSLVEHKEQVGLSERVDDIGTTLDDERFDQASPSRA